MENPKKAPLILAFFSIMLAVLPLVSTALASLVAYAGGCNLHEGDVNPCLIMDIDFGDILYEMVVMGWLSIVSFPIGLFGILIAMIWLIVVSIKNKKGT